jgi:hypothetical protein
MSIFGKKENEFEEEEEDFKQGRKITRKLKDLNPENKKKRKEPPKPWGKKERLIVLIVILTTTAVSVILLLSNNFKFEFGKARISLPRFSLNSINIFKGETIVIEKK